jgi:hypothetical protein
MESDIPFPLLAGQWIAATIQEKKRYIKISHQPLYFDIPYAYEIGPRQELSDLTVNTGTGSGAQSVFKTRYLKEWVTWIDNKYLAVAWRISSVDINSLNGFTTPQDALQTPYGTVNFPLFIYNNVSGNVVFSLKNLSYTKVIRGTLHILMYSYATDAPVDTAPPQYTDIDYKGE